MAAPTFDAAVPDSSFLFNIYHDGPRADSAPAPAPALPGGPCNYTDQTLPRCGCRRFWSRQSAQGDIFQDPGLVHTCMCSHHACFHEDVQPGVGPLPSPMSASAPSAPALNVMEQENERPKANREPLSPVQDLVPFQVPPSLGASLDMSLFNFQAWNANSQMDAVQAVPVEMEDPTQNQGGPRSGESSLPDTLNWGNFPTPGGAAGGGSGALPPIPSECLLSSQQAPPSTASSSQSRYLRPFAGRGLHTLNDAAASTRDWISLPNYVDDHAHEEDRPAPGTELASPDNDPKGKGIATPRIAPPEKRNLATSGSEINLETLEELSNTVQGHEQRIERLENASFSVNGHDDCIDKHDHSDLRLTDLESRVEQVENLLKEDNSSVGTVRRHTIADDAAASVVSVSTNATASTSLGNASGLYSQVQALQAQMHQLQAASLPTYTKPWELEVVFLPFALKGVWIPASEFPSQPQQQSSAGAPSGNSAGAAADKWTQMPNTISRATPNPESPRLGEWVGQHQQHQPWEWLLPKAFVNGRVIDQRLRSRGLIKKVLIRGSDARSVQLAITRGFSDVLRVSSSLSSTSPKATSDSPLHRDFLGLRHSWVPLRKIHKDSRLRFLSPAEMATPTLWDFTFLTSSVVMKATGTQRLYVTQPEAYLQDQPTGQHALAAGWTWQKLRGLKHVLGDSQDSSLTDAPIAVEFEECWAKHGTLDEQPLPPPPNPSALSFKQHKLSRRSSTSPSQSFYTTRSPSLSANRIERAQSPVILRERKGSRPPNVRTTSLPPLVPVVPSPSQSRRRVVSHVNTSYERRSSPLVTRSNSRLSVGPSGMATTAASVSKRRLPTRSPSLVPRNTPRYSRPSMSRSPSVGPNGPFGYDRRITPFYATPFSNAPAEFHNFHRANSRGPVAPGPVNGYDPEDDMDMDDDDDDCGSSTDYDSEATNDADADADDERRRSGAGGADPDVDIDVWEDRESSSPPYWDQVSPPGPPRQYDAYQESSRWCSGHGQGQPQLRDEDVPWPGIEDPMSDGENMDPDSPEQIAIHEDADASQRTDGDGDVEILDHFDADARSEASSVPSEYPATHRAWHIPSGPGPADLGRGGDGSSLTVSVGVQGAAVQHQMQLGGGSSFEIHEDGMESDAGRYNQDGPWSPVSPPTRA